MDAAIKAADPDRWARWLLRRGQEEAAGEDQALPSESAGGPSGSVDPVAVAKTGSESEASEEATERKPGRRID